MDHQPDCVEQAGATVEQQQLFCDAVVLAFVACLVRRTGLCRAEIPAVVKHASIMATGARCDTALRLLTIVVVSVSKEWWAN